ncbi:MAG: hemolysin activation protein [Clostridia bacterium]|nr:hemolysin activation protein [Clostridia bacterium]
MRANKIDLSIALVFFNRPDHFKQVFERVREIAPSELFLIQDGPRNDHDIEKILSCREIVNNIDWECKVHKNFSEKNLGCGLRVSTGLDWAFQSTEKLVILEDDCVPNESFFYFCKEMLDRYENDLRINMISGMNHAGKYDFGGDSYCFCKTGSIWGWATWKRVWDNYDWEMSFRENKHVMEAYKNLGLPKYYLDHYEKIGKERWKSMMNNGKLQAWTYQFAMLRHLYSQLVIVPKYNLINNVGFLSRSVYKKSGLKTRPKGLHWIVTLKSYDLEFPLKHPVYIMGNCEYDKMVFRKMGLPKRIAIYRKFETKIRVILFGKRER